ncbi:MAG: DHH family phosphoesterase [Candidatus Aenigmatarchaeota archaeon]
MNSYKNVAKIIEKSQEPILIVADFDEDGLTSAIQLKIILDKINKKEAKVYFRNVSIKYLAEYLKEMYKRYEYKTLIILDTPLPDEDLIKLAKELNNTKIIYIDHHKDVIPESLPENITYFDTKAIFKKDLCTSSIIYKIGKILFRKEFKKYSLIASIGALSDWKLINDSELLKDFKETYPTLYNGKYINYPMIFYILLFSYSNRYRILENIDYVFNPYEFFSRVGVKNIIKGLKNLEKEIKNIKLKYEDEDIEVYENKKGNDILPILLSVFKPNKVIVFYSPVIVSYIPGEGKIKSFIRKLVKKIIGSDQYGIGIVTQRNDLDVSKFLISFTKKYGIFGAGNKNYAGGRIYKKHFENLIREIKNYIKQRI